MSFIDIGLGLILVVSIIVGCRGAWQKKLINLGCAVLAIIIAYFTSGLIAEPLGNIAVGDGTLLDAVNGLVADAPLGGAAEKLSTAILPLVNGVFGLTVFWAEALLLIIIFDIVLLCMHKVFKKFKRNTAWKTFGIVSAIRSTIMTTLACLPCLVFTPAIRKADNIMTALNKENSLVTTISEAANNSFYLDGVDAFLNATDYKFLTYKDGEEDKNLYKEITTVADLGSAGPVIQALQSEDIIYSLKQLSIDDFDNAVAAFEANRDLLKDVVTDTEFAELANNIDFNKEANAVRAIIEIFVYNEDGSISLNVSNTSTKRLAFALCESEIAHRFLEAGKLADLPEDFKVVLKAELEIIKTEQTILSDEKYTTILSYLDIE